MEQTVKSKQNLWRMALIGAILVAIACLLLGSLGTGTSADAASVYDSVTLSTRLDYDADTNTVSVYYEYSPANVLTAPYYFRLSFTCGARSYRYEDDTQTASGYITKSLSGIEFFAGGLEYSVHLLIKDLEGWDAGMWDEPFCFQRNLGTFIIPGEIVPLPEDPVKEGHHFVGWYYDEGLTQPYDNAPIYADTQLYAKFEINTYTVTYDTDSDTTVSPVTVNWNTAAPTPEPTRTGYNFMGWYLADGTQYTDQPVTEDLTLTAHWEIKLYTVRFYLDGEVYTSLQVPHGSALGKVVEQAKVTGYRVLDSDGMRVSMRSTITDNTNVLIHELSGWEKYGDFVARNHWYTWLTVSVGIALAITAGVSIYFAVKRR